MNLQKQIQEKDEALAQMSEKLSVKSEECDNLMEERFIVRRKSSFDLQQVCVCVCVCVCMCGYLYVCMCMYVCMCVSASV